MLEKIFHNRVISAIVIIEFFSNGAYGIIGPFLAVFVSTSIEGGNAQVAGFAVAIYLLTKAIVQLPIARSLDRTVSERDDYWTYLISMILFSSGTFAYTFVQTPFHIYTLQVVLGVAYAMNMAALYGIFSRHLDKHLEGSEWSLFSVFSYSVGTAIAGALGGTLAVMYGFNVLFTLASAAYLVAALLTATYLRASMKKGMKKSLHKAYLLNDHEKNFD